MNEILVKGSDGKWYIARDGKLIPQDDAAPEKPVSKPTTVAVAARSPLRQDFAGQAKPVVTPKAVPAPVVAKPKPVPQPAVPSKPTTPKVALLPPSAAKKPVGDAPRMDTSDDFEKTINKAVTAAKLNFPDPSLTKRFKLLVASRLREVRRADDVHTLLLRETKVGGLGLSETEVDRVSAVVEAAFIEFHKKWDQVEADRKAAVVKAREEAAKKVQSIMANDPSFAKASQDKQLPISKEPQIQKKEFAKKDASVAPAEPEVKPFQKTPPVKSATVPVSKPVKTIQVAAVLKKASAPASVSNAAKPVVQNMPAPSAPAVTDIRKPKLFGPADELREMKLVDFRRMGAATEAAARIKAKIDMLGSESLARRREITTAWRQSEPYVLYSELMSAAISKGKSIDAEISERAKANKLALTIDEIDAIMGLNEQLRNP